MPRAKTKEELIQSSNKNFQSLFELIDTFSEEEVLNGKIPFEDRDKNMRDILTHLHHWHLMFLKWYEVGMSGEKPDMPSSGYTWKEIAALNHEIWKKYQDVSYNASKEMLENSFEAVQKIIKLHSEEELFTKKKYKWTGSTSLASYLISASTSHYDWAIKKVKKYKKAL